MKLAEILFFEGRIGDAASLMASALEVFQASGDEAAEAMVSARLGRFLFFEGERERAFACIERSLEVGERLNLPETVSQALNTKALLLQHRPYESIALMRGALEVAREHDLNDALARGYINPELPALVTGAPNRETEQVIRDGLAYSRRRFLDQGGEGRGPAPAALDEDVCRRTTRRRLCTCSKPARVAGEHGRPRGAPRSRR